MIPMPNDNTTPNPTSITFKILLLIGIAGAIFAIFMLAASNNKPAAGGAHSHEGGAPHSH